MRTSLLGYYIELGLRHLLRSPILTALIVATLAVGVASSMTTLTVLHAMSADPIPSKSDRLVIPLVDLRPDNGADVSKDPPSQLSYRDVIALRDARRGVRQSAMYQIAPVIDPARADLKPFFGQGMAVDADFFAMLEVPFLRGAPWSAEDNARGAPVVVVRESIVERVFGDANPIGRSLRLGTRDFVVTGVVAEDWEPLPRFHRLVGGPGAFGEVMDVVIPFSTAIAGEIEQQGSINCYGPVAEGFKGLKQSDCTWIGLWIELASPGAAREYKDFLTGYVAEQKKLGRFPRAHNERLYNVLEWLDFNKVVSPDSHLQTYLAFGFLLVCLVNVIGLLLAKFTGASGEIGVRRALGASAGAVFQQYLIEAGVVGLAGGVAGLALTFGALWILRLQSEDLAQLAHMDWPMLATTFALAIGSSLLAGILPTWRASRVQPALQLKSQ